MGSSISFSIFKRSKIMSYIYIYIYIYIFTLLYRHIHNTCRRTTQSFTVKHKHIIVSRTPTDLNLGFAEWLLNDDQVRGALNSDPVCATIK